MPSALGPHFSGEIASWLAAWRVYKYAILFSMQSVRPLAHQTGQNPDDRGHDLQATRARIEEGESNFTIYFD